MFEQIQYNSERWFELKDLKNEIWKPLIVLKKGVKNNYTGLYEASNYGRIKSLGIYHGRTNNFFNKPHIIKPQKTQDGYLLYSLSNRGKQNYVTAHRIIATTFIENENYKLQVNHIDGDKTNNKVNNLEWCTASENIKHAFNTGLKVAVVKGMPKEKNPNAKYTQELIDEIRKKRKQGYKLIELEKEYHITASYISQICNKKFWK
jgi:hypothetical protein